MSGTLPDNTVGTLNGWLFANRQIGQSIKITYPDDVTEVVTYLSSSAKTVMQLTIVYTDNTKANVDTATRTA